MVKTGRLQEMIHCLEQGLYQTDGTGAVSIQPSVPSPRNHQKWPGYICNWQIFANLTIKLIDPRRFLFPAINLYHGAIYSEVLFSFFGFMTSLRFCKPPLRSNTEHYGTLYLVNPSPFEIRRIWQANSRFSFPTPLGIGRDTKYLLNLDFDE